MIARVITSLAELKAFLPQWSRLYQQCPRATPFQSPEWLLPWMEHLFGGGDIWALAIWNQDLLIGFAPLFCWGTGLRTVSFLGAGISDYGDLLFAPGSEEECAGAVWNFLAQQRQNWDVLDLQEVRSDSALADMPFAQECSVCPLLDLATYPDTMDHKHRIDVRRARNKLTKHAALEASLASPENFAKYMEEFFRLHEARWGTLEDSLRRFHQEAAARFLSSGVLRLCLLEINSSPAAAIYAFMAGRTLYCYLSGYNPAMAKLSPGAVLLGWLIERAIAEGATAVDFLRHTESYKYLWGARDRVNYKLTGSSAAILAQHTQAPAT